MRTYRPDILIVEDNPAVSKTIVSYVEQLYPPMTVHICETGEDALAILKEFHPRSIILDIHLPGISGLEVLDCINTAGWTIPIVIVTADPKKDIKDTATSYDFVLDYLIKPNDVGRLDAMLYRLVLHIIRGLLKESADTLNCMSCPYRSRLMRLSAEEGSHNATPNGRNDAHSDAGKGLRGLGQWARQFVRGSDQGHVGKQV